MIEATPRVLLERMWLVRAFDEAAGRLSRLGEIPGVIHLTIGQEAAVVGACAALSVEDYMVGNHRGHGHTLAKGGDPGRLMAELLGKDSGVCRGFGGSQHVAEPDVGNLIGSAVLGSGVPVGVGFALASQTLEQGRVSLVFFGDGASNEGAIHESMNLASIWSLPVVFICENNGYAVTVAARDALSVTDVAARAAGYNMPGVTVDGQDVDAVHGAAKDAVARAREGLGPSLVEAKTYRFREHAENLPIPPYRAESELAAWEARDPIPLYEERLLTTNVLTAEERDAIEEAARARTEEAIAFARASAEPSADDLAANLYADGSER